MKVFYPITALLFFVYSCSTQDKIESFIPGTYVRPFDNEYYKGADTLKIELLTKKSYQIINYGSFLQKAMGQTKHEQEEWTAVYNKDDHVLYETKYGKVISFDPQKKVLYVGGSKYQKI